MVPEARSFPTGGFPAGSGGTMERRLERRSPARLLLLASSAFWPQRARGDEMARLTAVQTGVRSKTPALLGGRKSSTPQLHWFLVARVRTYGRSKRRFARWRGTRRCWIDGARNSLPPPRSLKIVQFDGTVYHLPQVSWSRTKSFSPRRNAHNKAGSFQPALENESPTFA